MPLLSFHKTNREQVLALSVQQVVSNAGDGKLRDKSEASEEFREFLNLIPMDSLFAYARQCLDEPFANSGFVLQDLVNELGRRLDFDVENGLYRGRRNAIGCDGIWRFSDEPALIIEVKSTDTYTFALETAHKYRNAVVAANTNDLDASILIVVGREDTGAIEAQVRGSRFAWDIRLISIESLIKLVEIRSKSDDPATVSQIHQILRPFEYTKVDRIIDVLFTTALDVESLQTEEQLEASSDETEDTDSGQPPPRTQERTSQGLIQDMKTRAIRAFSRFKGVEMIQRSRSYYWTSNKDLRACCTVSKRYKKDYQPYWYAYHPKWDEFLRGGDGYLILCCMDRDSAFAVPRRWFDENTTELNKTERQGGLEYWHLPLTTLDDGGLAINLTKSGRKHALQPYRFPLGGD